MVLELKSSCREADGPCGAAGSAAGLEASGSRTDQSVARGLGGALRASSGDDALVEALVRALEDPVAALDASLIFMSTELGGSGFALEAPLRDMQNALGRVQQRLEELAVTFRASDGALPLRKERLDLGAVLREMLAERAEEAQRLGVVLEPALPGRLQLRGDGELLRLAFRSVFESALGRCRRGSRLLVHARSNGVIEVCVSVSGAGSLPTGFFRGHGRHWNECGDAGLRFGGLAVAAHGGTLTVAGEPGGLMVRVTLPTISSGARRSRGP